MIKFFETKEEFVAVDIGSSSIKLIQLDISESVPVLKSVGIAPLNQNIFSGNTVSNTETAGDVITNLLQSNEVTAKRVVLGMPSPGVFSKRVQVGVMSKKELQESMMLEAGNYIPHNIDAVKIDYHVLSEKTKGKLDILLIAVKNEVVDSYMDSVSLAGLDPAVVDIDFFALQNMFELNYPEFMQQTVALLNIGSRFTSINVVRAGGSLFSGDVTLGGKMVTDEICDATGLDFKASEGLKIKNQPGNEHEKAVAEVLDKNTAHLASELNRQLSFFWNAAGGDTSIDRIMLCGGGSLLPGLVDELSEKTGIECAMTDPLKGVECGEGFDAEFLKDLGPKLGVAVGLALRELNDKVYGVELS